MRDKMLGSPQKKKKTGGQNVEVPRKKRIQ